MHTAERFHDISCGHRVVGHENKCRHLHGHNYRIHFVCATSVEQMVRDNNARHGGIDNGHPRRTDEGLDAVGRVVDFGVIKEKLCMWLEEEWDHKFLAWGHDPVLLSMCATIEDEGETRDTFQGSIVWVPFNPTAENMAQYLVNIVGPRQLRGTGVELVSVRIEETSKCSASYHKE